MDGTLEVCEEEDIPLICLPVDIDILDPSAFNATTMKLPRARLIRDSQSDKTCIITKLSEQKKVMR